MLWDSATQFWSEWGLRISVLVSLAAYALLGLLSGTRRRSASGSLWILQWALGAILWTLYQFAEIAATSALGNVSLRGSGADTDASGEEEEQQQLLIAFWAPFLLLHLGGPDNLTAYSLEDNILSLRKTMEMALQIVGVMYAIWNYIYRPGHSWVLFAAAAILFVEGAARYLERACALRRGNLDNMQEQDKSSKKPATEPAGSSSSTSARACSSSSRSRSSSSSAAAAAAAVESTIRTHEHEGRALDDGEALLLAQDLFHVWRRFLVDSSVDRRSPWQRASEKILSLRWRSMCKVVEMELSLVHEAFYTKAAVAHTWSGYLIRFMSPVCSAASASLFWLHRDRDRAGNGSRPAGAGASASFVGITYLLLGAAFALDVVWLLRALGSTWTYAFLKKTKKVARRRPWCWSWFLHKALCAGWWRRLHRAVVYLDPLRFAFGVDPIAYRRWSGTIGRYNLLHECTVPRRPCRRWLATKLGLEEKRYLSELPRGVKKLVFERVQRILPTADNPRAPRLGGDGAYDMAVIRTCWGEEALRRGEKLFWGKGNEQPKFGREFEEDVLLWHIATCIFLSRAMVRKVASSSSTHAAAIEVMSEYLMFLVAERRQMLPGLVLHSLLDETRRALNLLWRESGRGNKDKFITFLRQKRIPVPDLDDRGRGSGSYRSNWAEQEGDRLVSDAVAVAVALTKGSRHQQQMVPMLDLIFNVWVDKLLYASIRCSRESHAKQLSRGGELTTVLWMVVQHAGPFHIGEEMPADAKKRQQRKSEEKKEEEEEEKKKKKCKAADERKPEKPAPTPPQVPWMSYPYPFPYPPSPYPLEPPIEDEPPVMLKPMPPTEGEPEPEEARLSEIPIPDDEEDPEDARDYRTTVEYITLY